MSNLCPDDGPPRLIRFVTHEVMPSSETLSVLDRTNNLLLVQKELFDLLTPSDQRSVIATDHSYIEYR